MNITFNKNNIIFSYLYYLFPSLIFFFNIYLRKINYLSVDQKRSIQWIEGFQYQTYDLFRFIPYLIDQYRFEGIFFIIPLNLYSLAIYILNENWFIIIILINYLIFLISLFFLKQLFFSLNYNNLTILIFPFILCTNNDLIVWSAYTLPDFFSFCLFTLFFYYIINLKKKFYDYLTILLVLIISIFTRPTNFILILILFQSFFMFSTKFGNSFKYKFSGLIFIYLLSIIFISLIFYLDYFPKILFPLFENTFQYYRSYFLEGAIIHHRFDTYVDSPLLYFDYVNIILLRLLYFFSFIHKDFSDMHNLYNLLYYIPIYGFGVYSLLNFKNFNYQEKKIIILMVVAILTFALFFSFTLIDYDWRYRINCNFCFSFLSFFGIKIFISSFLKKNS